MSRNPKADVQQAPGTADSATPADASAEQLWAVDADGGAMLVAQASAIRADLNLAVDNPFAAESQSLLDASGSGDHSASADQVAPAYDGHVALVVDALELANVDATFDMLTSSADLFDVPSVDSSADSSTSGGDASAS